MGVSVIKMGDFNKLSPLKARHYKGGIYEVISTGLRESNRETQVIYRDTTGQIWIRPLAEFVQFVTDADGNAVQRFTLFTDGANAPACVPIEALTNPEPAG